MQFLLFRRVFHIVLVEYLWPTLLRSLTQEEEDTSPLPRQAAAAAASTENRLDGKVERKSFDKYKMLCVVHSFPAVLAVNLVI